MVGIVLVLAKPSYSDDRRAICGCGFMQPANELSSIKAFPNPYFQANLTSCLSANQKLEPGGGPDNFRVARDSGQKGLGIPSTPRPARRAVADRPNRIRST